MPHLFLAYELHESDTSTLQELVKALQQLRSAQPRGKLSIYGDLSVALRRFNQSYERETPEDQIIDLTIALESTLLGDLRDELKYRLVRHCSPACWGGELERSCGHHTPDEWIKCDDGELVWRADC